MTFHLLAKSTVLCIVADQYQLYRDNMIDLYPYIYRSYGMFLCSHEEFVKHFSGYSYIFGEHLCFTDLTDFSEMCMDTNVL
jgi:hypothetical protein